MSKIILHSLAASVKPIEQSYVKELNKSVGKVLINLVKTHLLPFLKENEANYTKDSDAEKLAEIAKAMELPFAGTFSQSIAEKTVNAVAEKNAARFNEAIPFDKLQGINLARMISNEKLDDFVKLSIAQNSTLIKSIPSQFLNEVQGIVYNSYTQGLRYSEIEKKLIGMVGSAGSKLAGRIKTIARTETQKINSQLTKIRSQALGIKKGIWQSSKDERVRASHAKLNGVEFDLEEGAWSDIEKKFLFPGMEINCRCSYKPVIDLDDL